MGIQGQNYMLWTSSDVSFDNLTFLLEHRLSERQRSHLTERIRPKVVVDASLLGYKVLGSNNVHASDYVWGICTALATRNIDVLIICETKRHHSKRASQQRIAAKERDSIELMTCRMELSCSVDTDETKRLSDRIQSLEKRQKRGLPTNFVERLYDLSTGYQSELYNGTCISIETAPYQADPCIADVALLGECEAIISGDSHFAMYVGPGGPDKLGDLMLRNVMYDYKNRTIVSCKLITGQRAVKNLIHNILTSRMTAVVFEEDPQHPLFDGIEDPKLRVLFAIALGCDALPHVSGQKNFGAAGLRKLLSTLFGHPFTMPEETEVTKMKVSQLKAMLRLHGLSTDGHKADLLSRLQDYINKPDYKPLPPAPVTNHNTAMKLNDPNVYVELAERIASFRNTTPDAIMSMLNSVYYEPTGRGYMYCEPTEVDEYIKEFAAVVTKVVPGPAVAECKGCCNGVPHKFLVAEGVNSCTTCKAVLCQFCVWEEDAVAVMCFECKRFSLVGEDMPTEEDYPSESVMRQLLKNKYSANVPATASYHQVVELYKMKSTREPLFPEIANIKYPLQPTSCLDPLHPSSECIKKFTSVRVRRMGQMLQDDSLPAKTVLGLLHQLAALATVEPRRNKQPLSYKHVFPKYLLKIDTRLHDNSERLYKRACRHAMDPACPDILDGTITVGEYNGSK